MRLKTVLHRVRPVKSFIYEKARLVADEIEITVRPRRRVQPLIRWLLSNLRSTRCARKRFKCSSLQP